MNLTDIMLFGGAVIGDGGGGNSGGDTYSGAKALVLKNRKSADISLNINGFVMHRMGDVISVEEFNDAFIATPADSAMPGVFPVADALEVVDGSAEEGCTAFVATSFGADGDVLMMFCYGEDTLLDETTMCKAGLYVNDLLASNVFPTMLVYGVT